MTEAVTRVEQMDEEELRRKLSEAVRTAQAMKRKLEEDPFSKIGPNRKQWDFITSKASETLLSGPNQAGGKSTALAILVSIHLTGLYPPGWTGPVFDEPVEFALGGRTGQLTRDNLTDEILGDHRARGSGFIPRHCFSDDPFEDIDLIGGGVPHQVDTFRCKHHSWDEDKGEYVFDGWSKAVIFSYASGAQRMEGYTLQGVACDEAPDPVVYGELSARLNFTDGLFWCAMNPVPGSEELYELFEDAMEKGETHRRLIPYTIDDCEHITPEHIARLKEKYRNRPDAEARLYGKPLRGEGLVVRHNPDSLVTVRHLVPDDYHKIIGIDLPHTPSGTFACVRIALTKNQNPTLFLTHCYKDFMQSWSTYADAVIAMGGKQTPVAWPHDAQRKVESADGSSTIVDIFRSRYNIEMLHEHSSWVDDDGNESMATMGAVNILVDLISSGRFKVMGGMGTELFIRELKRWRLKDGKIKRKQEDHVIDAVLKAIMMTRYAEPAPDPGEGGWDPWQEDRELDIPEMAEAKFEFFDFRGHPQKGEWSQTAQEMRKWQRDFD